MANQTMPHHRLIAYEVALELVKAVHASGVRDSDLRDQAMRAARSAALNTAEGAGRSAPKDKARVFAIARAEATEAAAAIEIAVACGDSSEGARDRVVSIASRLTAMLTALIR